MKNTLTASLFLVVFLLGLGGPVRSQPASLEIEQRLERLLIDDKLEECEDLIREQINRGDPSLTGRMVYWLGKLELQRDKGSGVPQALELNDSLLAHSENAEGRYYSLLGISRLYNELGDLGAATDTGNQALEQARKTNNPDLLATAHYYLGEYGLRMGSLKQFQDNTRKSLSYISEHPPGSFKIESRTYNYMGALMYFTGQSDSALYYYSQALDRTASLPESSENRLYFPAAIKANMVLLYQRLNEYEKALELARECVVLNSRFLKEEKNHPLRFRSQRNQSLAYRNLASLYEQVGDYTNTLFIARKAYDQARSDFEPQLLEYFSAVTLYAEALISNRDFEQALHVLREANESLTAMPQENPLLYSNYHSISASAHFGLGNHREAKEFYEQAQVYYDKAQIDPVSNDRVFGSINLALSYGRLGEFNRAYATLEELKRLLQAQPESNARLINTVLAALTRVSVWAEDYPQVIGYSDEFLRLNPRLSNDAVRAQLPEIYLSRAKARFYGPDGDSEWRLARADSLLERALEVIDNRKITYSTDDKADDLIRENAEVFDFAKTIKLERYRNSGASEHLRELIGLHESSIYQRIRTRLNARKYALNFNLPSSVLEREEALRARWEQGEQSVEDLVAYRADWDQFLDSVATNHPSYFALRYANTRADLSDIQQHLGEGVSLVRYLLVGDEWFAYVLDLEQEHLIGLGQLDPSEDIAAISDYRTKTERLAESLSRLYRNFWAPLESAIRGKRVVVLPDGPLYNLNFELLTPVPISKLEDMSTHSLLSRYVFSYHYSLPLIIETESGPIPSENFMAFVPGFTSEMKQSYTRTVENSDLLDASYLSLLPQPFVTEMVKRTSRKLGGRAMLGKEATKQRFASLGSDYSILHLGSHAESNNVNPDLSRLLFAKNLADTTHINDNSLYAYEIYDLDLRSRLTVLTACETGKPSFQPGEGMVSLAHAFDYAGSESLITSLWRIDETASSTLLDYFYRQLSKGISKDEALRNAKLEYLSASRGRVLHPQYWAGLIIMGDSAPVELHGSGGGWWMVLLVLAVLIGGIVFYRTRKALR